MICINCLSKFGTTYKLQTTDTANFEDKISTYRRKKCPKCGRTYYTKEVLISDDEGRLKFRLKARKYDEKTQ